VFEGRGGEDAVHDQAAPAFGDGFGNGENPAGEPRAHIAIKPVLQVAPFLAGRKQVDAFADFSNCHNAREDPFSPSVLEERLHADIWRFAGKFGWNVGVNQVSVHNSISRPGSLSRSKFKLSPRRGAKSSTIFLATGTVASGRCTASSSKVAT